MFPARFFPSRMFAPRFFPKTGSSVLPPAALHIPAPTYPVSNMSAGGLATSSSASAGGAATSNPSVE